MSATLPNIDSFQKWFRATTYVRFTTITYLVLTLKAISGLFRWTSISWPVESFIIGRDRWYIVTIISNCYRSVGGLSLEDMLGTLTVLYNYVWARSNEVYPS